MFGYNIDKRMIYGVLAFIIILTFVNMPRGEMFDLLITLPAVIIAITFHEFAHAFTADKLGDTTPRNQGRITLNPLKHLDPFGFLLLMFAHIGWGRPVQINPNNFNSNKSIGFCESIVSLAGPLMNFFIAIISCVGYAYLVAFKYAFTMTTTGLIVVSLLAKIMTINIGLGVFNLIPLPPLDGEKIFRNFLPYRAKQWLEMNYQTLYIIFMILWFCNVLGYIVSPVINTITRGMLFVAVKVFSIFM